jgi:cyclophilin family peptidyl-prolyl cis-trans isomerase
MIEGSSSEGVRMRSVGVLILVAVTFGGAAVSAQTAAKRAPAPPLVSPGAGPVVVVETERGTFEFETYPKEAPKTTEHILGLVRKRFYNGQRFHRLEPKFVLQVGDPASRDFARKSEWGHGGSGKTVGVGEFSKLRTHVRGAVALAHPVPGHARDGDSQFYITLSPAHRLDGDFTVFGKVISGMDVVTKLGVGDRINRVTVKGER